MTLAAHEDKTYGGAYVASPSMPWVWGQGLSNPSDVYHKVWSRDLYQVATALLAAGDRAGANRSVDYLFTRQQKKTDGCFPQNSNLDGSEKWTNLQLDEVAFPIVLAWQLGRRDTDTYDARQGRGRLHPRQGSGDAAGALGEPGRLVAGDDRVGDRRARHRRRHRARQRPRGGGDASGRRRRTSGRRRSTAGR